MAAAVFDNPVDSDTLLIVGSAVVIPGQWYATPLPVRIVIARVVDAFVVGGDKDCEMMCSPEGLLVKSCVRK